MDDADARKAILEKKGEQCCVIESDTADFVKDGAWVQNRPTFDYLVVDIATQSYEWDTDRRRGDVLYQKMAELSIATDAFYAPMLNKYSEAERQSWLSQESESNDWLNDNQIETPTIDALYRGEDKAGFCQSIVSKAQEYKASLTGIGVSQEIRKSMELMSYEDLIVTIPSELFNEKK